MNLIGNIIWLIFGGIIASIVWFIAGFILCVSVIGLPFGVQCFEVCLVAVWKRNRSWSFWSRRIAF